MEFDYEKKNYIITYKNSDGKEHLTSGYAFSKYDAEVQFRRNFNP